MEEPTIADGGPRTLAPPVPSRGQSAADRVRNAEFPMVLRGYDRDSVDRYLSELAGLIEELEARQTRESVVQRALEEIGQQTSAILKQAHESADELTARSRSQSEGRLERARREAEQITADAEARAERLERDTVLLWDERARLIEEVRRLAEETLGVADDALERMRPPTPVAEADAPTEEQAAAELPPSEEPAPAEEPPAGEEPREQSA
jgi:DivIVA domain-containing protein